MTRTPAQDVAGQARQAAIQSLWGSILFPIASKIHFSVDTKHQYVPAKAWLTVSPAGVVWLHPKRRAEPQAWTRLMAIALVCLGFGLVRRQQPQDLWELASLLTADRFCDELKLGKLPEELQYSLAHYPTGGAEGLLRQFCVEGCDPALRTWQILFCAQMDFFCNLDENLSPLQRQNRPKWGELLAEGIAR